MSEIKWPPPGHLLDKKIEKELNGVKFTFYFEVTPYADLIQTAVIREESPRYRINVFQSKEAVNAMFNGDDVLINHLMERCEEMFKKEMYKN